MLSGRFGSASSRNPFSSTPNGNPNHANDMLEPSNNSDSDNNNTPRRSRNNNNGDDDDDVLTDPITFTYTRTTTNATNNNNNNNNNNNGLLAWRERERRQRTVRVLIMFLLMLLLMDGEEGPQQQPSQPQQPTSTRQRYRQRQQQRLRARQQKKKQQQSPPVTLSLPVWTARQSQEEALRALTVQHPRYWALVAKNQDRRIDEDAKLYLERIVQASRHAQNVSNPTEPIIAREADLWKMRGSSTTEELENSTKKEEEAASTVWHYPWNTTGFYRGQWTILSSSSSEEADEETDSRVGKKKNATTNETNNQKKKDDDIGDDNDKEEEETALLLSQLVPPHNNNLSGATSKTADNASSSLILEPKTFEPFELENILLSRLAWQSKHNRRHWQSQQQQQQLSPQHNQSNVVENMIGSVFLLPPGLQVKVRDDHNLTQMDWDQMTSDVNGNLYSAASLDGSKSKGSGFLRGGVLDDSSSSSATTTTGSNNNASPPPPPQLSLTRSSGRAAFQLYSKVVPGMKELSLVDGFCKLYDHTSPGYSTRNDVLLRVRGVLLHGVGHLSLVSSNVPVTQTALVLSQQGSRIHPEEITATTTTKAKRTSSRQLYQTTEPQLWVNQTSTSVNNKSTHDGNASTDTGAQQLPLPSDTAGNDTIGSVSKEERIYKDVEAARRRLQEAIADMDHHHDASGDKMKVVLRDAELLVEHSDGDNDKSSSSSSSWFPFLTTSSAFEERPQRRRTTAVGSETKDGATASIPKASNTTTLDGDDDMEPETLPIWSDVVVPYPYVMDDEEETVRKTRTPGSRRMPHREQLLESNSMDCPFEMSLQIQETEWALEEYRTLMKHKWNEHKRLDPTNPVNQLSASENSTDTSSSKNAKKKAVLPISTTPYRTTKPRKNTLSDQALVITMVGTIQSRECDFHAHVNVTALRTDWDATTSKAINYSFYMMLVCLIQIILLLRQLLHSQTQSAATRVSMICIGWQTVLDALICLGHIYLCLAMQPLFTAFASVAFFKCLIFCVIEMKYMAIIIQARNSASGGQPTEVLRRQVAILHLRFYLALLAVFLILFYVGEKYRTWYMLCLYSFWLPQIILNAVTEAKMPMHKYYIYGMSITRMVVPMYLFGIRNNFLKEVYPEAPYDPWTCQWLILWVGFQTAMLVGQSKYGARFWIPPQFLPPKYDYSRPIPPSILSNARNTTTTTEFVDTTRASNHHHHATSQTTRNRMRTRNNNNSLHGGGGGGGGSNGGTAASTDETQAATATSPASSSSPSSPSNVVSASNATTTSTCATLDCSICYEPIDVMRQSYMLAPCDHLFHKDCLLQWMDVKMECPICRTDLPAL